MIRLLQLALCLPLAACTTGAANDAGNEDEVVLGACEIGPAPSGHRHPAGPYGTAEGETLAPFALERCDRTELDIVDVLASGELTLLTIGAGWCQPCVEETRTLQAEVFEPYCADGLRVVQVMLADSSNQPATPLFCEQWVDRFGLSFPVLIDPLEETDGLLGGDPLPLNLLVTSDGEIVYRAVGEAIEGLPALIEEHLP